MLRKTKVSYINRHLKLVEKEKMEFVNPVRMSLHERRIHALSIKEEKLKKFIVVKGFESKYEKKLKKEVDNLKAKLESYSTTIN